MPSEARILYYTAKNVKSFVALDGSVMMRVDCPDLQMSPNVALAFRFAPGEARSLAAMLLRKADEAEAE